MFLKISKSIVSGVKKVFFLLIHMCGPRPLSLFVPSVHTHHKIINSHYFSSSLSWRLSLHSCSLLVSAQPFGVGSLRLFSNLSEPHLIKWAPHCPSERVGFCQPEWCKVMGESERSESRKEKVWLRRFVEPCVEVAYFLGEVGRERLAFCQW